MLPDCINGDKCEGSGRYHNDDGEVLDLVDNSNVYQLGYAHTNTSLTEVPTTLTFSVSSHVKA